jgi:hypothetical protein
MASFEISSAFSLKKVIDSIKSLGRINIFFPRSSSDVDQSIKIIEENEEKTFCFAFLINKSNLISYVCPENFSVNLSITDLDKALKSLKRKETVKIIVNKETGRMTVEIKSGSIRATSFVVVVNDDEYDREAPTSESFLKVFSIGPKDFAIIKTFKGIGSSAPDLKVETTAEQIRLSCSIDGDVLSSSICSGKFEDDKRAFSKTYPLTPFIDISKLSSIAPPAINIFPRESDEANLYTLRMSISVPGIGSIELFVKDTETIQEENAEKILAE